MTGKKRLINYEAQINKAILFILKQILKDTAINGLKGDHHFYIKVSTLHPGFSIQDSAGNIDQNILDKYPKDITIVLQNAFEKLAVEDSFFSVVLNFSSVPRTLIIPFESILAFHDPFANFAVHFDQNKYDEDDTTDYIDLQEYEEYMMDDIDEDIAKFLEYDYLSYKLDKKTISNKVIYLDDIKKKLNT
jgi:hypothetical protein